MKLKIGDIINWKSAAGALTGTITNIVLAPNAAGQTIAWMDIKDIVDQTGKQLSGTRLCANDGYLKQMRVELA